MEQVRTDCILQVDRLCKRFGGVAAVRDVSFDLKRGEILGLVGPNGAGKTSCFNLITGFYRPDSGDVLFEGRPLTGMKPHRIARAGVVRSFRNNFV